MEGTLNIRVLLNQSVHFWFKHTVCHFVGEDDFSHVDIFLVKGIVKLNALEFVSPLLPFLNEPISFSAITNLAWVVIKFIFPNFLIFEIGFLQFIFLLVQLLKYFFLMNQSLIKGFILFHFLFQFLIFDSTILFVKDLVFLHTKDDIFESFGLHLGRLLFHLDIGCSLLLLDYLFLEFFPSLLKDIIPLLHKLDFSSFEFHIRHLFTTLLIHLVIVLTNGT